MARQSKHDHVHKICSCTKWKDCKHPWYVNYFEGREAGPDGKIRRRSLRKRLSFLVGREPKDFADAKNEARRAILAWQTGRDAADLLPDDAPTLAELLQAYGKRQNVPPTEKYQIKPIVQAVVSGRPFGEHRAAAVTRQMLEAFRAQRPRTAGNRSLAHLRAMFNWAVLAELVPTTPFKVGNVSAVKLATEEGRTRRLFPGEEDALLAAARGTLRDMIIAAIETGCRAGELRSLQWLQVFPTELFFPAGKTKSKKPRRVPISSVLAELLARRRVDPAGDPQPPSAYVFGDEVGRQRRSSFKRDWQIAVLKANGKTPVRVKGGALSATSAAEYKDIGLHFHDLRREAGSRWMDAGVPLATIQRWLGHHNISQTSTYLAASGGGDADAMAAFERKRKGLIQIDPNAAEDRRTATLTDGAPREMSNKNAVVH